MPKLHLKRTPDEEAAHQLRKQKRKLSRNKRKDGIPDDSYTSHKRPRKDEDTARKWASSDEEPQNDSEQGPSSSKHPSVVPNYDKILAELEEKRFREKMFEAFEDDDRLDSLEARFNDFANVPGRWRPNGGGNPGKPVYDDNIGSKDEYLNMDPRYMDEEEYAEWIRVGMYRCVTSSFPPPPKKKKKGTVIKI